MKTIELDDNEVVTLIIGLHNGVFYLYDRIKYMEGVLHEKKDIEFARKEIQVRIDAIIDLLKKFN